MQRKFMSILCLLLVITMTIPAMAATSCSISLSANDTSVNAGDSVTISVSATVDSCSQGSIEISYDSKVFELVSGECTLSGADIKYFDTSSKDGGFAFEKSKSISGSVFKFVLKVKSTASVGKSAVSVKFKADSKSASKNINITVACTHKYDNNCDTSCNICGSTRSISHKWNSGKVTTKATCSKEGSKTYTCTVCGKTKTESVSKLAHSYSNACDTSCNACGATRKIKHNYKQASDENSHWMKCKVCGNTKDKAEHTFSKELSHNADTHGYACTVCGKMSNTSPHSFSHECATICDVCYYERQITHNYSEQWSSDVTGHWHECMLCKYRLEKIPHTPGDPATETENQICTDCGYILQYAGNHTHTMAGDWLSNDVGHWFLCVCGKQSDPEPHKWNEGTIDEELSMITYQCTDCGHTKTEEYIPPTTVPETVPVDENAITLQNEYAWMSKLPWQNIAIVLFALLLISVGFNIFFLLRSCIKTAGKYNK